MRNLPKKGKKPLTRDGACGKIRKLSREGSGRKGRNHTGVWKKALKKVLTNGTGCGMIGRLSSKRAAGITERADGILKKGY